MFHRHAGLPARLIVLALLLSFSVCSRPCMGQWPPPWLKKPTKPPVYQELLVSPDALAAHVGDDSWTVVDARPETRFQRDHVPGARNVDARATPPVPSRLGGLFAGAGIPSTGTVICYSDSEDPSAAGELFWLLELAGHGDVRILNGGIEAWKASGCPTRCTSDVTGASVFDAAPDTSLIADFSYVLGILGDRLHTLMEIRPAEEWEAGHIPHSLSFPLSELLNDDGTMMDGPSLRPYFEAWGPRPNDYVDLNGEMIVPTGRSTRHVPVHPYVAARVGGLEKVRGYPGAFSDWSSRPDLPVVRVIDADGVRERLKPGWRGLKDVPPKDFALLDLRAEGDFARGHVPGAVWLRPSEFETEFEPLFQKHWPGADRRTIPIVFYCYGPTCVRSRNCATIAARQGFLNLLIFRDGTLGWRQIGEALVEAETAGK